MKNNNKNKKGGIFCGCCCYGKQGGKKKKVETKNHIYNQTVLSDGSHPSWLNFGTFWKIWTKHIQNISKTCKEMGER